MNLDKVWLSILQNLSNVLMIAWGSLKEIDPSHSNAMRIASIIL